METAWNASSVTRELIQRLRGARTQAALSRALGFRSNVLFAWESGRDAPAMPKFFALLARVGHSPVAWLRGFGRGDVDESLPPKELVASFLRSLATHRKVSDLAGELSVSRYVVSRWLSGQTEVELPDFLRVVEALTLSGLDLLALLVDPAELPSAAIAWNRLAAARRSARERPWSHAIVHMVELPSYRGLSRHEPGWFGSRLGISQTEERECLDLLVELGRLSFDGCVYRGTGALAVDTRPDPASTRELAAFWMQQGVERVRIPGAGRFGFNVFGIRHADLERLRDLQSRYFAELRAIVADSEPTEAVAVATFQLFPLVEEERR